jgi:hypothetical protein
MVATANVIRFGFCVVVVAVSIDLIVVALLVVVR